MVVVVEEKDIHTCTIYRYSIGIVIGFDNNHHFCPLWVSVGLPVELFAARRENIPHSGIESLVTC